MDLSGWEADEPLPPPEHDSAVVVVAIDIQAQSPPPPSTRRLPTGTTGVLARTRDSPRAGDAETRGRAGSASRHRGSVPAIEFDPGRPRQSPTRGALLRMVVNDLGAGRRDSRIRLPTALKYSSRRRSPAKGMRSPALAFVDKLAARRNEPLRHQRSSRRALLAEARSGPGPSHGARALDALAAWPTGVSTTRWRRRPVARAEGADVLWPASRAPKRMGPMEFRNGRWREADASWRRAADGESGERRREADLLFGLDARTSPMSSRVLRDHQTLLRHARVLKPGSAWWEPWALWVTTPRRAPASAAVQQCKARAIILVPQEHPVGRGDPDAWRSRHENAPAAPATGGRTGGTAATADPAEAACPCGGGCWRTPALDGGITPAGTASGRSIARRILRSLSGSFSSPKGEEPRSGFWRHRWRRSQRAQSSALLQHLRAAVVLIARARAVSSTRPQGNAVRSSNSSFAPVAGDGLACPAGLVALLLAGASRCQPPAPDAALADVVVAEWRRP